MAAGEQWMDGSTVLFEATYPMTYEDQRRLIRAMVQRQSTALLVLGVVMLLLAPLTGFVTVGLAIVCLTMPVVAPRLVLKGRSQATQQCTTTVTTTGLWTRADDGEWAAYSWTGMTSARLGAAHWVLLRGNRRIAVPATPFTGEDVAKVRGLLANAGARLDA